MRPALFTVILMGIFVTACQQQSGENGRGTPAGPVVATIGGHNIHEMDIDAEFAGMPEQFQQLKNDAQLRGLVLQTLIRRHALSQHAREVGLHTDSDVQQRMQRANSDILISALQEWEINRLPPPSEEEIKAYYEAHKEDFGAPEQVHARHILVDSEKKAWEMLTALRKGKKFETLAAEHSLDDSNKNRGGDLNWFPRGVMVKPFEDAAFNLKRIGAVSSPVQSDFGWHVVELLGKREASQLPMDQVRGDIVSALKQEHIESWVQSVIEQKGVEILKDEYIQTEAQP